MLNWKATFKSTNKIHPNTRTEYFREWDSLDAIDTAEKTMTDDEFLYNLEIVEVASHHHVSRLESLLVAERKALKALANLAEEFKKCGSHRYSDMCKGHSQSLVGAVIIVRRALQKKED